MRTIMMILFVAFAVLLAMPSKMTAQDSCPYPVSASVSCDDGAGCKHTRIVSNCSGPKSSSKCQFGLLTTMCCGQELHYAEQAGPCDGNGGPLPAFLEELKSQPISVQARVYVPSCSGAFVPAISKDLNSQPLAFKLLEPKL